MAPKVLIEVYAPNMSGPDAGQVGTRTFGPAASPMRPAQPPTPPRAVSAINVPPKPKA